MTGTSYSPSTTLVDAAVHSIGEVNELSRAAGREGEYRQLSKGRLTSQWRSQHLGQFTLTSNHTDKCIHAHVTPARGCVTLAIVPPPYFMLVNGVEFGNDEVLVMDANQEVNFVSPNESACITLAIPKHYFWESVRALFPRFRMRSTGGLTRIMHCPSSGWQALHGEVRDLLHISSVSPEDLSHLLSRFLDLMAGEPEKRQREICLGTTSIGSVARSAQEYIEDHYPESIRMEDLCRCTGVSMRTVQRSFSEYFHVSPFEYIKACRLNAARQALEAGDSSCDRVTRIAVENGFSHLGRFAVDYRKYFEESPNETLARGKRGPGPRAGCLAAHRS